MPTESLPTSTGIRIIATHMPRHRLFLCLANWLKKEGFTRRNLYPFLYLRSLKIGHNLGYTSNKRHRGGMR
jgi:hypothetical protein